MRGKRHPLSSDTDGDLKGLGLATYLICHVGLAAQKAAQITEVVRFRTLETCMTIDMKDETSLSQNVPESLFLSHAWAGVRAKNRNNLRSPSKPRSLCRADRPRGQRPRKGRTPSGQTDPVEDGGGR